MEIDKKNYRALLLRRMFLAIVSNVILQFFLECCLILFANISTDYTHWLWTTWETITSPQMWVYFAILIVMSCLQSYVCSRTYIHVRPYHKSRFAKFYASLTIQTLVLGTLYSVIGGILAWLHLSLMGVTYSIPICNTECELYFQEEHYFLLLGGFWIGIYIFVNTSNCSDKRYRFPIIAQSKFARLTRGICIELPTLVFSIWPMLYYLVNYYFVGHKLFSNISAQVKAQPLDTLSRLLNLKLLSHQWLHQFLFMLTISSMHLLFEIYLTEWVQFKLNSNYAHSASDSEMTLFDALSMNEIPIIQHLAFLDLVALAQKEQARRRILFTLSQPGGHPYSWNCTVKLCMDLLMKFSSDLNTAFVKPQEQVLCYSKKPLAETPASDLQASYVYHMRKLIPDVTLTATSTAGTEIREISDDGWLIQRFIKQKRDAFKTYLLSKPLINFIFDEQDYNKISYVLLNAQPVIWAAEAISSLSAFSLTEDSYGIVQLSVPIIISVLLSVKQPLDKLQKSAILLRKMQMHDQWQVYQIFMSLRSAIKRSLYRVTTHFELYIKDLFLEPLIIEQLQGFLNHRE